MAFRGEGAGGRGASAALLVVLAARAAVGGAGECLLAWRVAGGSRAGDGVVARCRDGDPACDADGTADGACTFAVGLCLDAPGCEGDAVTRVRVRGRVAAPVASAAAALVYPVQGAEVCTNDAAVRVALGGRRRRRATAAAVARDAAGHTDRDRLRLVCERATAVLPARAKAVVATTDFETGQLATVDVEAPHAVRHPPAPIHSDAVIRTAGGLAFVVNRFLADNLEILDPRRGFATVLQCSTGAASNPHDVAVVGPHKAYVTRYGKSELWIVDPGAASCDGFHTGTIDLGPYADADGLPEMSQMAVVGDRLFVTLEWLDRGQRFAPAGRSRLAVIDLATDTVTGVVLLTGRNAFGDASGIGREPGTGKLVVAEVGNIYHTGDGGLERIDPLTLTAEGFFLTEDELGGNPTDFVLVSPTKGYAVLGTDDLKNVLVAFDPTTHAVRRLLTSSQYLPDIALAPDGTLWLADQSLPAPGIRIFDPADDRPLTPRAIDVGLPPFSIGFVP